MKNVGLGICTWDMSNAIGVGLLFNLFSGSIDEITWYFNRMSCRS